MTQPQPGSTTDGSMVTAVLKLTDLAARVERVEQSAARRIEELAADCAKALAQVADLREEAGTLGGRADGIEHKLGEVSALLSRMSAQIDDLTQAAGPPHDDPAGGYQVNPAPPWWQPGDDRCDDTRNGSGTGWPRCTGRYSATSAACSRTAGISTPCAWPTWT